MASRACLDQLVSYRTREQEVAGSIPVTAKLFRKTDVSHSDRIQVSLTAVSAKVMSESSQWLGKNTMWITGQKNFRKGWVGARAPAISQKYR